jgi:hypothetical protein
MMGEGKRILRSVLCLGEVGVRGAVVGGMKRTGWGDGLEGDAVMCFIRRSVGYERVRLWEFVGERKVRWQRRVVMSMAVL